MSYAEAKKIYDAVRGVIISDMALEEVKKEDAKKSATESLFEDEEMQELKEAAETAGKLLEAEKSLLDALF